MSREPWSPQEDEQLTSLCGDMPWPMVVTTYTKVASDRGWPKRTANQLRNRSILMGASRRSTGEWLAAQAIAKQLGMSQHPVYGWIRSGRLKSRRFGSVWYVSRKDLRAFANKEPHYFAGLPEADLLSLLSNEQIAQRFAKMPPARRVNRTPVIRVSTGQRFPTLRSAAKAYQVPYQRIQDVLDTDRPITGSLWRRA
jgi:hypothetical protein